MTTTAETLIADLDGVLSARVDGGGAVRLDDRGWVVDWMVATESGWQMAADAGTPRRHLVERAPVVETVVRVEGGQVVHRAFVAADRDGVPVVVVEARNDSPHAVGLAFMIRSLTDGTPLPAIEWTGRDTGEAVLRIGDEATAVLPEPAAVSGADDDESLVQTLSEPATSAFPVEGAIAGVTRVALVRPLPHTLTTRIAVSPDAPVSPTDVADAEAVARGWARHSRGGGRVELPEPVLNDLVAASRAQLLLAARSDRPDAGVGAAVVDARLADGLGAMGQDRLAAGLGARRLAQLDRKGFVDDGSAGPVAATGATLQILGGAAAGLEVDEVEDWLPEVSGMLVALDKAQGRSGTSDTWESFWIEAGRRGAERVLRLVGQDDAADQVRARRSPDTDDGPVGLLAALGGRGVGASSWSLMVSARAEIHQGRWPDEQLRWLVAATEATGVVPLAADDHLVAAELVALWRDLGAVEGSDGSIAMLPAVRSRWLGHALEAHDIPVGSGSVGFAIRWHGERPALLWESHGIEGVTLTCPGLDPGWSTREAKGDALLAVPALDGDAGGSRT